ncbi:MAG: hypothetical protein WED33_11940 [Bacteroidia bacterium]
MKILVRFFSLTVLFFFQSCLRDDFSKLSDSEWSPDLAFPLVNSTLTVNDILIQDQSPTTIDADLSGLVRIIYDSDNYSDRAANLISIPQTNQNQDISLSSQTLMNFENNQNLGYTITDSTSYTVNFPLNSQFGGASILDTVFFKTGQLDYLINSFIPHNTSIRIDIPQLFILNEPFTQTFTYASTGNNSEALTVSRNLSNAFLVLNGIDNILVKVKITTERTGPAAIPSSNQLSTNLSLNNTEFRKISGFFGNFQMPLITNDTLQIRIFGNTINAQNLLFENAETTVSVQNSTGIPINYNLDWIKGFRMNSNIPDIDISAYSFPQNISGQNTSSATQVDYQFNASNSNVSDVINLLPRYMLRQENYSFNSTASDYSFLSDTSRLRFYQKLILPLNGLTLDLLIRDTIEFNFDAVNSDIEEILLRLNIDNGFPLSGLLQIYFARQNENVPFSNPVIVDSLYPAGNLVVMESPEINSNGEAANSVRQITDAVMPGSKWQFLKNNNCNRIIVNTRLTTSDLATLDIRVLKDNILTIRIGARIKLRTSF